MRVSCNLPLALRLNLRIIRLMFEIGLSKMKGAGENLRQDLVRQLSEYIDELENCTAN